MELRGVTWALVEMDGEPAAHGNATIDFTDEGRVFGCASLNRFMGSYEATDDSVTLGQLAATLMAGPPDVMAQEQRYLAALSGSLRVELGESELTLRGLEHVLRFARASISV
jgi:heat shock protein HslJ